MHIVRCQTLNSPRQTAPRRRNTRKNGGIGRRTCCTMIQLYGGTAMNALPMQPSRHVARWRRGLLWTASASYILVVIALSSSRANHVLDARPQDDFIVTRPNRVAFTQREKLNMAHGECLNSLFIDRSKNHPELCFEYTITLNCGSCEIGNHMSISRNVDIFIPIHG